MEELIKAARELAHSESKRTGTPPQSIIDLSVEKAKLLARRLDADEQIVEVSAWLMDCALGLAKEERRQGDHQEMGVRKAEELFLKFSIPEDKKKKIKSCILEHHGVEKFSSLESEICCNADCYRFASVKGFCLAYKSIDKLSHIELVDLLKSKLEEKWNAISIKSVKKELAPEKEIISQVLNYLSK